MPIQAVQVHLIKPARTANIAIEQVALLEEGTALAITRSDPGDNLDLTRNTPVWAIVAWESAASAERVQIHGGEGVGRQIQVANQAAVYAYAQTLLKANLEPLVPTGRTIRVTIVLPEGRSLASRTSNAAFGVVDGLSLLGTSGIAEPLSAPGQLEAFRQTVRNKARQWDQLIFCVGENGLDKAVSLGLAPERRIKTGNWIGPLLLEAALAEVRGILLLGYHGKLIKLAGGIFHTHHYVADGRQEILTAIAATQRVDTTTVQTLLQAPTIEAGLAHLRAMDNRDQTSWVSQIYSDLVDRIDRRAIAYIQANVDRTVTIGTAVFDRQREIIAISERGQTLFETLLVS